MTTRPELLVSPSLPPPLYDFSPRKIKGSRWWSAARGAAEHDSDSCCYVCGINKGQTRSGRLFGHEVYDINYETFTVTLREVVVLCRRCYNFIHFGRLLRQYLEGSVSQGYVRRVLRDGLSILSRANIKPLAMQRIHYLVLEQGASQYDARECAIRENLTIDKFDPGDWSQWKIVIDGKKYGSPGAKEWLAEGIL